MLFHFFNFSELVVLGIIRSTKSIVFVQQRPLLVKLGQQPQKQASNLTFV